MNYAWFGVPSEHIDDYVALTSDLVKDAIEALPDWTVDGVFQAIKEGYVQLWMVGLKDGMLDGVVLTQILTPPGAKFLHILGVAASEKERYTPFVYDVLAPYAKSKGCDYMQAYARTGWTRTKQIKDHGWEKVAVVIRKPLHDVPSGIPSQAFTTH